MTSMESQWEFRFFFLTIFLTFCMIAYYFTLRKPVMLDIELSATLIEYHTPLNDSRSPFQWQQMFMDFYFYSLYPTVGSGDSVEIHSTIAGSGRDRNFWKAGVCHCLYHSTDKPPLLTLKVKGVIEQLSESHWDYAMIAGRVRCPFPNDVQNSPSNYSLVDFRCQYGNLFGVLTFHTPDVIDRSPSKLTFAQCGAPMWGRVDRPAALVEFIEYNRLMGVSKFFWYDMDVTNKTRDILRYYEKKGLLDLTKWSLPWKSDGKLTIHYYGQIAALYDCAMKTAGIYDYTVMSDIDEYFATSLKPASFSGIVKSGLTDCAIVRSAFMDPSADYSDRYEQQSTQPVLQTARIRRRSSSIFPEGDRSKYVCRMRYVDNPMIHSVQGFRGGNHVKKVPSPETSIVLHFRSYGENQWALVNETRATVFLNQLQAAVFKAWQEIFG